MSKMKSHAEDLGYIGCCDGIEMCFECHYHEETSHIFYKYRPRIESWYKKIVTRKKKLKDVFPNVKNIEMHF